MSTLSADFTRRAGAAPSFRGVPWAPGPMVPVDTLDALIARHGRPDFVKIDVEGFEHGALLGLSQPLPGLSFEFLSAVRDIALECIDRLEMLAQAGPHRDAYAVSWGERLQLLQPQGLQADAMGAWLLALAPDAPSDDVHAWWVDGG